MTTTPPAGEFLPPLLTMREVERVVSLHRASVYRMIQAGRFPPPVHPVPGVSRWRRREVEAFLDGLSAAEGSARPGQKRRHAPTECPTEWLSPHLRPKRTRVGAKATVSAD